ncbi:class I SAM-dependent methyltransferase [Microlunatus sp. GCM10028923]|uniref:class I SAM-dependent methyltransferase n=1 Tax=Microlunatus sp. GCM10028923 TaxID=3273400 RepID=UPI00360852FA
MINFHPVQPARRDPSVRSPDPSLRETFDQAADFYLAARPTYPDELFDDLIELCGLGDQHRLVEIGAGPGTATLPLAQRGHKITALEPGAALAARAQQTLSRHPRVEVINTNFENWHPPKDDRPDVIYAANAWHWVDPAMKWAKTADLLAPTGQLAVFDAGHAFPADFDPFFAEIQSTYAQLGRRMAMWPPTPPEELPDPTPDFEATGQFSVDAVRRYVWATEYDAERYINLLRTFSDHIAMTQDEQTHLFTAVRRLVANRPRGLITRHWISTLVIAHPRSPDPRP